MLICAGASLFGHTGGDASAGESPIVGSPSAGSTTITVDDSLCISAPSFLTCLQAPGLCTIDMLTEVNGEIYHHAPEPRGPYQQYNWITNVSGSTVTLARPLIMDLPEAMKFPNFR